MYYLSILLYDYRKFDKNEDEVTTNFIKLLKYVQFSNMKCEIYDWSIQILYLNIYDILYNSITLWKDTELKSLTNMVIIFYESNETMAKIHVRYRNFPYSVAIQMMSRWYWYSIVLFLSMNVCHVWEFLWEDPCKDIHYGFQNWLWHIDHKTQSLQAWK